MIRYRDNSGRGRREHGSNLRGAPRGLTPDLVGRILAFADALSAAATAAEQESVQLRPVRMPKVKPTAVIEAEAVAIEPVEPTPVPEPIVVPGPAATRFTAVLASQAQTEREQRTPTLAAAPRPRLGTPNPPKPVSITPHPLERASSAIAWLRANRVSVSVASSGIHGTRWFVSGYPNALDAKAVIELAIAKGMGN